MTDAPPTDPFESARSNLRDTIKWLITALAGLAVAVLGGSPLTSFGTLAPGWRLYLAIGAGALGLAFILIALYIAFRLLVREPFFLSDVVHSSDLHAFIEGHAADLLPPECEKFEDLLAKRKEARATLRETAQDPNAPRRADATRFMTQSDRLVDRLVSLAYYVNLRQGLLAAGRTLFALAVCAVVALGAFAWAANPSGKSTESVRTTSSSPH